MKDAVRGFTGAADLVDDPLLLVDGTGRIRAGNPAARLLGAEPAVLLADIVADSPEDVREQLRRWHQSEQPTPGSFTFRADPVPAAARVCLARRAGPIGALVVKVGPRVPASVAAQRSHERLRRLYALSAALAAATSMEEVARIVQREAPGMVGARSATLGLYVHRVLPLLDEQDPCTADLPWINLDDPHCLARLTAGCLPDTAATRYPEGTVTAVEGLAPHGDGNVTGQAAPPVDNPGAPGSPGASSRVRLLTLRGHHPEPLGTLRLEFDRSPADEEATHLEAVTHQVAQAVSRAGLYEHEHRLAQRLQMSLLPTLPQLPGLTVAARYSPGSELAAVGGDWYDLFPLPDGLIGLAIGDVAGHGLTEATEMAHLRSVLRAAALRCADRPGEVMEELNAFMCAYMPERTATACYLVHDPASGLLRYTNAGHMPPLLSPPGGSPGLLPGCVPLLGLPGAPHSAHREVKVEPGATLLLYTDGLVERRGQTLDDGFAFLAALMADTHHLAPDMLCRLLVDSQDREPWPDDRALMVIRFEDGTAMPKGAPAPRSAAQRTASPAERTAVSG